MQVLIIRFLDLLISTFTKLFSTLMVCLFFISFISFQSCDSKDDPSEDISDYDLAKMEFNELKENPQNVVITFPESDPGIPIYARVGPILNQFFVSDDQLVIPFYRNPECIPETFNLLNYYDPPVAFGCDLMVGGQFVIEQNAEEGAFPIMAYTTGESVPFWIVEWSKFQPYIEEGSITIAQIEALNPIKAAAEKFEEYLSPRMAEHRVIIEAEGKIPATGQSFSFSLVHSADEIKSVSLDIH